MEPLNSCDPGSLVLQLNLAYISRSMSWSRSLLFVDITLLLGTWIIEASALPGVNHISIAMLEVAGPLLQLAMAAGVPIFFFALYMHLSIGPVSYNWATMSRALWTTLEEFFIGASSLAFPGIQRHLRSSE